MHSLTYFKGSENDSKLNMYVIRRIFFFTPRGMEAFCMKLNYVRPKGET